LENDFSFTPVRSKLQVNVVAVAPGKERVTGGIDWKPFLPLARHLQQTPADEQEAHTLICGGNGLFSGKNQPGERQDWLQLLDTRIRLPQTVQAFALETGLLESLPDGSVRFPQRTRVKLEELIEAKKSQKYVPDFNKRLFTAIQPIQEAQKFLS